VAVGNSLGAARSLGIRMHSTGYAIARKGLDLKYSITQDMLADFLSKKMPRKPLARMGAPLVKNNGFILVSEPLPNLSQFYI
jgi:hypothetical protein